MLNSLGCILTGPLPSFFLYHLEILSPASFNFFFSTPEGPPPLETGGDPNSSTL